MQTAHQGSDKSSLVERVQARRDELKLNLGESDVTPSTRNDIEAALAAVSTMLTGDLANLPNTVKGDLSRWLEIHRHLGLKAGAHPVAAVVAEQPKTGDAAIKADAPAPSSVTVTVPQPQPKIEDTSPQTT